MQTLDITNEAPIRLPSWLQVTDEGVRITLSAPLSIHEVRTETLHMRSPTLRELRACQKAHPNDDEAQDAMLFSSLANIAVSDVQNLTLRDYERVKVGYFRLVKEDDVWSLTYP